MDDMVINSGEPLASGGSPYSFMALRSDAEAWKASRAVIIPVPYDGTTTFISGTREGPRAIIMASRELEPYDEEMAIEPCEHGIFTLDELPINVRSPEDMLEIVRKVGLQVLQSGKIPVLLGGEHLITLGMIQALKDSHLYSSVTVLHLDAHADLKDEYQGSKYSNACVIRRIIDYFPTVSAGIRSLTKEEHEFSIRENIPIYFAKDIIKEPSLWDSLLNELSDQVYITIDLDVLDPSDMPAVGTPEPGGVKWYDLIGFLKKVCLNKRVVGFDVMELCPVPGMIFPDFTAARLVYKILAYIFSRSSRFS